MWKSDANNRLKESGFHLESSINLVVLKDEMDQSLLQLCQHYGWHQMSREELPPAVKKPNQQILLFSYFEAKLGLQPWCLPPMRPLVIDFSQLQNDYRNYKHQLSTELLIRAANLNKQPEQKVLDATAGLAIDTSLLIATGAEVILSECHPVISAMLADALKRARLSDTLWNLELYSGNSIALLKTDSVFDVIYLDPMFPENNKKALVKKEMQIMQQLHQHLTFRELTLVA